MRNKHLLVLALFLMLAQLVDAKCKGSKIYTINGLTEVYTCPQDDISDNITFINDDDSGEKYAYVITDKDQDIIHIEMGNSFDFDPLPEGKSFVWGFSYTGNITAVIGENVFDTDFSDSCFQISRTAIKVIRDLDYCEDINTEEPEDCISATISTTNGESQVYTCTQNGEADLITFSNTDNSGANFAYAITDDKNDIIHIELGNSFDFDPLPVGNCKIWGFSYTGNITGQIGEDVFDTDFSDACFEISSKAIKVIKEDCGDIEDDDGDDGTTLCTIEGGNLVGGPFEFCVGNGIEDKVSGITLQANTGSESQWVITNGEGSILGLPAMLSDVDFDQSGVGTCLIWHLSYEPGLIGLGLDMNANDLVGCFDLSNSISVTRTTLAAGVISTESGEETNLFCVADDEDDLLVLENNGSSTNSNYAYVMTDEQNNFLEVLPSNTTNFEGTSTGVCRIWGLSYTGNLTVQVGDNAATTNLTDGCFKLTNNFITVVKEDCIGESEYINGGDLVVTSTGTNQVTICVGDALADPIDVDLEGASGSNSAWFITDIGGNVLGLPVAPPFDLEGAPEGVCLIWHLSYEDGLEGLTIGSHPSNFVGSYNLSNPITVTKIPVQGGTITTSDGLDDIEVIVDDGQADIVEFVSYFTIGERVRFLVTDNQNTILSILPDNMTNFEGNALGIAKVWALSYTGNLTASVGDNINTASLSDACFELSENHVNVKKSQNSFTDPDTDNPQFRLNPNPTISGIGEVKVSPNPTSDHIFINVKIENNINPEKTIVSIYSTIGQLVMQKTFATVKGQNRLQMDLNNLHQGLYRIVIQNGKNIKTKTISKVNIR